MTFDLSTDSLEDCYQKLNHYLPLSYSRFMNLVENGIIPDAVESMSNEIDFSKGPLANVQLFCKHIAAMPPDALDEVLCTGLTDLPTALKNDTYLSRFVSSNFGEERIHSILSDPLFLQQHLEFFVYHSHDRMLNYSCVKLCPEFMLRTELQDAWSKIYTRAYLFEMEIDLFDISPCFDDIDTHAYRKNLFNLVIKSCTERFGKIPTTSGVFGRLKRQGVFIKLYRAIPI